MSGFFPDPKPEKKVKEKYKGIKRTPLKKKPFTKEVSEKADTPELIRILDNAMSEFVRLMRADKHGIVQCFTCPNKDHWTEMQCGHFIPRKSLATRHKIENCQVQCPYCNEGLAGNLAVYAVKLDEKYGVDTAYNLKVLSKTTCKRPAFEYQELIETYTECVTKLKANLIEQ